MKELHEGLPRLQPVMCGIFKTRDSVVAGPDVRYQMKWKVPPSVPWAYLEYSLLGESVLASKVNGCEGFALRHLKTTIHQARKYPPR